MHGIFLISAMIKDLKYTYSHSCVKKKLRYTAVRDIASVNVARNAVAVSAIYSVVNADAACVVAIASDAVYAACVY